MAIMASWSDADLDDFLRLPLEATTAYTLVDPEQVREMFEDHGPIRHVALVVPRHHGPEFRMDLVDRLDDVATVQHRIPESNDLREPGLQHHDGLGPHMGAQVASLHINPHATHGWESRFPQGMHRLEE